MRYRRIFFICLFISLVLQWAYLFTIVIHGFENYSVYLLHANTFIQPVTGLLFFMALGKTLEGAHLMSQVSSLEKEQLLKEQREEALIRLRKDSQQVQTEVFTQLKFIKTLLKENHADRALKELSVLRQTFEKKRPHIVCSDSLLNTILLSKKELAEQHHISVNYQILMPEKLKLPETVLPGIFFNLLDNGIEGCIHSRSPHPFINLTVQPKAGFLHINMENSKNPGLTFSGKTTKPDSLFHGFGLAIMEEIADRYDGSCQWIDNGSTFQSLLSLHVETLDA